MVEKRIDSEARSGMETTSEKNTKRKSWVDENFVE